MLSGTGSTSCGYRYFEAVLSRPLKEPCPVDLCLRPSCVSCAHRHLVSSILTRVRERRRMKTADESTKRKLSAMLAFLPKAAEIGCFGHRKKSRNAPVSVSNVVKKPPRAIVPGIMMMPQQFYGGQGMMMPQAMLGGQGMLMPQHMYVGPGLMMPHQQLYTSNNSSDGQSPVSDNLSLE